MAARTRKMFIGGVVGLLIAASVAGEAAARRCADADAPLHTAPVSKAE